MFASKSTTMTIRTLAKAAARRASSSAVSKTAKVEGRRAFIDPITARMPKRKVQKLPVDYLNEATAKAQAKKKAANAVGH